MKFHVDGMSCGGCVAAVQSTIEALDGVISVEVSLDEHSAVVEGSVSAEAVADAVTATGYPTLAE